MNKLKSQIKAIGNNLIVNNLKAVIANQADYPGERIRYARKMQTIINSHNPNGGFNLAETIFSTSEKILQR